MSRSNRPMRIGRAYYKLANEIKQKYRKHGINLSQTQISDIIATLVHKKRIIVKKRGRRFKIEL